MKLKKIYLLMAFLSAAKCAYASEETTLFENDHWRVVSDSLFSQEERLEEMFSQGKYDQIVGLDSLIGIYVNDMGPKIQEWKENEDSRVLDALKTIVLSGKMRKTLGGYLSKIFDSYIKDKEFQKAYGIETCFESFRKNAHDFFKANIFKAAVPLLDSLLKMYPSADVVADPRKAEDRFYLMMALMHTEQYTEAEKLSEAVLNFMSASSTYSHLQLSICAVNAFICKKYDKAMEIVNRKLAIGNLSNQDYVIMSVLHEKIHGVQSSPWSGIINDWDSITFSQVAHDTKWLRDIVIIADLDQRSEPVLKEPSNKIEELVQQTLCLQDRIRDGFYEQAYDRITPLLIQKKENIQTLNMTVKLGKIAQESLEEINSSEGEMAYYDFFIKFNLGQYDQAVQMKDAVLGWFLSDPEQAEPRMLHHLMLAIFFAQGLEKAFEFLPTLEQHAEMDIETWVLSLFLRVKKKLDLNPYIDATVLKMKEAGLSKKELGEVMEWVNDAADLLPGKENKSLFKSILTWIDPEEYDKKALAAQALEESLASVSVKSGSMKTSSKKKAKAPKSIVVKVSSAQLKREAAQEEKERVKEEQRIAREAAQIRKEELERQKLEQEALEAELKKLAKKALDKDRKAMMKEDRLSREAHESLRRQEKIAKNMGVWNYMPVTYRAPQISYKADLAQRWDYLINLTLRGSKELIFQKSKLFPEIDAWRRRVALQKQLGSSQLPSNPASRALLKMLRTEHAVEYREIQGTFYAIYKYNPFSVLYAPDERIVPGTFGYATKPLKEGDKLHFVPIVE